MSILPGLLSHRFVRFRFYTPIGVERVRLHRDGIVGQWKQQTTPFYGDREKTVAERFVNWGWEGADVERFTKRYGPLVGSPQESRDFSFPLESWCQSQSEFRKFWHVARKGHIGEYQPLEGNTIEIRRGWLHFRCGSLWTFMTLELLSQPEKLRFCARPDCGHRYFVAQHGKERYCSTECANWSQSQLKKRWHEQQRRKRLLAKESGKKGKGDGTRKTR